MGQLLYVDYSNLHIEGGHLAAVSKGYALNIHEASSRNVFDYQWQCDFGRLFDVLSQGLEVKRAVVFGSNREGQSSRWELAAQNGFEVVAHERDVHNREKMVDIDLALTVLEDALTSYQDGDIITLVTGDRDFVPLIDRLMKRRIPVRVMFWAHASRSLREHPGVFFSALNPFLKTLCSRSVGQAVPVA